MLQATEEHFHSMLAGEDTVIELPAIEHGMKPQFKKLAGGDLFREAEHAALFESTALEAVHKHD